MSEIETIWYVIAWQTGQSFWAALPKNEGFIVYRCYDQTEAYEYMKQPQFAAAKEDGFVLMVISWAEIDVQGPAIRNLMRDAADEYRDWMKSLVDAAQVV